MRYRRRSDERDRVDITHVPDVLKVKEPRPLPAIALDCPACNAQPYEPCTAPTDTGRRSVRWFHFKRTDPR